MLKNTFFLAIVFAAMLYPLSAFADLARIDNVRVVKEPELTVSFTVKDAFTREIEDAIKSGIPTDFTFRVELVRVRGVMPDEALALLTFKHIVKYDSLKDEYEIRREEAADSIKTNDAVEMKRIMTTCADVLVGAGWRYTAGEKYVVRIKAELKTTELPFILDHLLFFLKFWDVETNWHVYNISP